jgi:SMODS domain-containing protein
VTTVSQAFVQFLNGITITDYQKTSIVEGRRDRVIENLTAAFPSSSDLPFSAGMLMGSAAKGTIIRPIDDIDVLAVFSNEKKAWQNTYQNDSQAFLYRVRRAYDGLETAQVGARGQAVRIFFQSGGHVDVAPVFKRSNGDYHLPAGNGGWIITSPFVANDWFKAKNAELGYNVAPLVRLLKKWNESHSKRLKSFHLETMAASAFSSLNSNRQNGLQVFFNWAGQHLDVSDPGRQSGLLSGYLSQSVRDEVKRSFAAANDRATKAINEEIAGNHDEAKRLWKIILGDSFPLT